MALASGTRVHGALPKRRRPTTGEGSFALDVRRWVEKVKDRQDLVVQKIAIDLLSAVVKMSPVGNPELWAANASAAYARQTYNLFADQLTREAELYNAGLASMGESAFRGQRLIGAKKGVKRAGKQKLAQMYPLRTGKDYVGGRFKGNWQVSVNSRPTGETGRVDASGSETLAAGTAAAKTAKAGDVIYLVNNVPYAIPLEYGWSKQAPGGMVRITVARFQQIVDGAVADAKVQRP